MGTSGRQNLAVVMPTFGGFGSVVVVAGWAGVKPSAVESIAMVIHA
jgi:hypothetical protein